MPEYLTTVQSKVIVKDLWWNKQKILTYSIAYPVLSGPHCQAVLSWINRFYREQAEAYRACVEKELLPKAEAQCRYLLAHGYPIMVYQAMTTFRVSDNRSCILSLVFDRYEFTGGAHGSTQRSAQVWNLRHFPRICLKQLICCGTQILFAEMERQIRCDPGKYFDNYAELLREHFSAKNFYSTPSGLVVFYPQYAIAPYSSGICEFRFPYSPCVKDPTTTCIGNGLQSHGGFTTECDG